MPTHLDADQLNQKHGAPGVLRFEKGQGDLVRAVVSHPQATGEAYLLGAHVAAWTPAGQNPVLWMSEKSSFEVGKPIRGGIPICFPWFGPKADDPSAPAHGVARTQPWSLHAAQATDRGVTLDFALTVDAFEVQYRVVFAAQLELTLAVTHVGERPQRYEAALHTYFDIADIHQTQVHGLEGTTYLDSLQGRKPVQQGQEAVRFTGETDRIYFDRGASVTIDDAARHRRIRIEKSGSVQSVVWNPWIDKSKRMPDFGDDEWPGMVCVETANVADAAVALEPGESHRMNAIIRVEAM